MRVHACIGANEVMACPSMCSLRLTPMLVCSHPLQDGKTPLHHASPPKNLLDIVLALVVGLKADPNAGSMVGEAWWWVRGACAVDLPWLSVRAQVAGKGSDWGPDAGV